MDELMNIADISIDAIVGMDQSQKIFLWNPAAERLFGYTSEEAVARLSVKDLMPEEFREQHSKGFRRFISSGKPVIIGSTVELVGLRKDGTTFPMELSLSAKKTGSEWNFISIIRDVTARKAAQEELKAKNDKLTRVNGEMSVLFEISSAITHDGELENLLGTALGKITSLEVFNVAPLGCIFTVEGERLVLKAQIGDTPECIESHRNLKVGECLCGQSALTGKIIVSSDCDADGGHTIRHPSMTPHGHIIVPLKVKDEAVGVLCLYLPAGMTVGGHQKELLTSVGNLLGVAINNFNLFEKTKELSLKDSLTGLANRRFMAQELERNISLSKRYGTRFSVILADIDFFKKFNDTKGHLAGDGLIKEISSLFVKTLRETDIVIRFGGEEFLVILPSTGATMAAAAAERLRKRVGEATDVTLSLGVASFTKEMQGWEELIRKADDVLYQAKNNGRNQVSIAQ